MDEGGMKASEVAALLRAKYGAVVQSLSGETNYNPATSVALWKPGQPDRALSELFLEKLGAGGAETADRSKVSAPAVKVIQVRLVIFHY
jgi:hypothetical protein